MDSYAMNMALAREQMRRDMRQKQQQKVMTGYTEVKETDFNTGYNK